MRLKICLSFVLATLFVSSAGVGQDMGIFGGRGIRGPETNAPEPTKSKWPKLLDFSKDETKPRPENPFSGMFKKPTVEKPSFDLFKSKKPNQFDSSEKARPFTGFSDLFPKRDPKKPSIFKQMNTKSKDFFDRSTNWTQRRNQSIKDKTFGTWDDITRDMRNIQAREKAMEPAQPPIRTAESEQKPGVQRF